MTHFQAHTIDSAPADSRPTLQAVQRALGFLPNLFATMAESPATLGGYTSLDHVLAGGTFDAMERQFLHIVISSENGCAYCTAAHSTIAASLGAGADLVAGARGEARISNERLAALSAFTRAVIQARGHVPSTVVANFLLSGFTRAQALEVAANIGLKTISNFIDGFAHVPLDDAFVPHQWHAVPAL